ncbi:MAG: phage tail sheath family protein [Pyrinomonadaceae bacterium]
METLHPGVYIQEIPSGLRPIEGVSTSNAAFIGKSEMGPVKKAKLVTNLQQFESTYGGYLGDSSLSPAVQQFFNNGGRKAYIVRIAGPGAIAADISIKDRKGAKTLTIRAANEGAWGNKLDVVITDGQADPNNEFAIQVYQDRSDLVPPLSPILLETHNNLSMNASAKNYVQDVIAANSKYIAALVDTVNKATAATGTSRSAPLAVGNGAVALKLGVPNGGTETPGGVGTNGTSRSGVTPSTNPAADERKFRIDVNGDGAQEVTLPATPATGADIAAAIQTAVRALTANTPGNQVGLSGFTCVFQTAADPGNPSYLLSSGTTGAASTVVVTNSASNSASLAAGAKKFVIEIDGDGPHVVTLPAGALANGAAIASAIQTAVQALTPKRAANTAAFKPPPAPGFTCTYENSAAAGNPSLLMTSGTPAGEGRLKSSVRISDAPSDNVAGTLKLGLKNGGIEVGGSAILRPANSKSPSFPGDTEYHLGDASVIGNVEPTPTFGADDDGNPLVAQTFKDGFPPLDIVRDVNIVAVPGIGDPDVVGFGASYCALRGDCFFIGDAKVDDDSVDEAKVFINKLDKTSYAAVYFPWLEVSDPTGQSAEPIKVPPSGFVAGLYARIDAKRGVWKAPAGTEANVTGAVGLVAEITDVEQDFLNPIGMNAIRQFPGAGRVVWGSRTLGTVSDPEYRYVPVRRTAIYLEQSIYNGIQWAVFEPNDEDLWASLRLNIGAFMMLQFRAGAFQGKSAKDAFFVKCDNETTTQGDIDAGIVNILVGFAPLKPAEFVILKLTQIVGQQA